MISVDFKSVKDALSQPQSRYFWVNRIDETHMTGNRDSFYANDIHNEHLTFDISNNKALVNVDVNGSIKYITFYRDCYRSDNGPGGWMKKDFSTSGPYSYSIKINGEVNKLDTLKWSCKTSFLDNIFPITEFTKDGVRIVLITYTPISADGAKRPRAAIYGMFLENCSGTRLKGSIILPKAPNCTLDTINDIFSSVDVYTTIGDYKDKKLELDFDLMQGQHVWVPTILYEPGQPGIVEEIDKVGSLGWLNSTWTYFKGITGNLIMDEDVFTEEFFKRQLYQCISSIGMNNEGDVAGSNWGSYPSTQNIWMKDMYYSYLPLYMSDPEFFKKGMLWFFKYSIRPNGPKFKGGVRHSLSNSLIPVVFAGLYFSITNDKDFFVDNKELKTKIIDILDTVIKTREDAGVWLFPSDFVSDGYSMGDYHTGSNVIAWYSFKMFSQIMKEVYCDKDAAVIYSSIAEKIKDEIESRNIIDGSFGKQYIEGVNKDGTVPCMFHDGEETDTTLMPFYGYTEYDSIPYKNYSRFAISESNLAYLPETKGMIWDTYLLHISDATFPGYITGFSNVIDYETMNGSNGYMTEIKKLTDLDGSIWWWPYTKGSKYGNVTRNNLCGKCGWAAGVFAGLFITQILGIRYDAPSETLYLRPFSPSSNFSWQDFRMGRDIFSVSYHSGLNSTEVEIFNKNNHSIKVNAELIHSKGIACKKVYIDSKECDMPYEQGEFLGNSTVKIKLDLLAGECRKIAIGKY